MGDLIFAERPILVVPALIKIQVKVPRSYTQDQIIQAQFFEWERVLEKAFTRVTPERQAAYKALHNSHLHDGSGPLLGVVRTNGFQVGDFHEGSRFFFQAVLSEGVSKTLFLQARVVLVPTAASLIMVLDSITGQFCPSSRSHIYLTRL
jgi:hypothetical protein